MSDVGKVEGGSAAPAINEAVFTRGNALAEIDGCEIRVCDDSQ